jgi:hypothetical protein
MSWLVTRHHFARDTHTEQALDVEAPGSDVRRHQHADVVSADRPRFSNDMV